jgi:hypothetical protein
VLQVNANHDHRPWRGESKEICLVDAAPLVDVRSAGISQVVGQSETSSCRQGRQATDLIPR